MTDAAPALIGSDLSTVTTERLRLRSVQPDDLAPIYDYLSRSDVCRYLLHEPKSSEQVADGLAKDSRRTELRADGDSVRLAVLRRADDRLLGEVGLSVQSTAGACLEIGWIFHPDHSGRGYATEAARALLDAGFTVLRAHRVVAQLDPANDASIRLCRRLGMRQEAHHVANWWIPDRQHWEDTGVFAILRREWQESRR